MLTSKSFITDFRQSVRSLWREKVFTLTILATFALCLGANAVIFTVLHAVVLKPLPFPDPDRLVVTYNSYPNIGVTRGRASVVNYYERREGLPAFAEVAALREGDALMGEGGAPERVTTFHVTPSFFRVLGIQPAVGRFFLEEEGEFSRADVVILSDDYWCQRLKADPAIVGKTVNIEGRATTIVGVLPRGFRYLSTNAMLWRPLPFAEQQRDPRNRHSDTIHVIARLRPEVSIAQAQAQIDVLNEQYAAANPGASEWAKGVGFRTTVAGLQADHIAEVKPALLLLQGGVLLLLLIGTVNIVNLLIVRASARAKEMAVRQALGASRRNIAIQCIAETMLLALLGGLLGLGLGAFALKGMERLGVHQLPLGADIALAPAVALITLSATLVIGLLVSVPMVASALRSTLATALAAESRSGTATRSTHRLRHALIVAQVALAFMLLAEAALLALSFKRVLEVVPGFQPERVITAWVGLPWKDYRPPAKRAAFVERWLRALETQPGVNAAGAGTSLPVVGDFGNVAMRIEGHTPPPGEPIRAHHLGAVAGDYFRTLGIPLRDGRYLNADDTKGPVRYCVIDQLFAQRYWPGRSALGQRISFGTTFEVEKSFTVAGVVDSVKQKGLTEKEGMGMLYYAMREDSVPFPMPMRMATIVRTTQSPEALVPALRQTLARIDPTLALDDVKTMTARVQETLVLPRSTMLLGGVFAVTAVLLAAIGVYGVLAYAVAQRRREIGVRLALGALPHQIVKQFLGIGGRLLLAGLLIGVVGAWAVARTMRSLLYEISPVDGLVFLATGVLLSFVVLCASFLPSRRAARVSVMDALRSE